MDLVFIGSGSSFNPVLKSNSAYLVVENDFFLLDCGENVFGEIWEMEELRKCKHIYVLITHLHGDHVGSLGTLISYCYCVLQRKITIIHPVSTIVKLLDLMGIEREYYDYSHWMPVKDCGLSVASIEVRHTACMKCFGYILKSEQESIYYSGDASEIPEEILEEFFQRKIQYIYQDTASYSKENSSHCHIRYLDENIPFEYRKYIYCMHLDENYETIEDKGFQVVKVIK